LFPQVPVMSLPRLALCAFLVVPILGRAAAPPPGTLQAVVAEGGELASLDRLHTLELQLSGELRNVWQSRSTRRATPIPNSYRFVLDYEHRRHLAASDFMFPGGHRLDTTELERDGRFVTLDHLAQTSVPQAEPFRLRQAFRFHPLLAAREVLQATDSPALHRVRVDGRDYREFSALQAGRRVAVLVETAAPRIAAVRFPYPLPDEPDALATSWFRYDGGKYVGVSGAAGRSGAVTWNYAVVSQAINRAIPAAVFAAPEGFAPQPQLSAPGTLQRLALGTYLVKGLGGEDYNALVVELEDRFLVAEAPFGAESVRQALQRIAPGKPVGYLVLTHHHGDHLGGAGELIDPGTVVIAPAAARDLVEAVLAQAHAPAHQFIGLQPGQRHVVPEADVAVTALVDNPHADDILYLWLPRARLAFQTDMIFAAEAPRAQPPLNERGFAFLHELALARLAPERIAGGHGDVIDVAGLARLVGGSAGIGATVSPAASGMRH
jgi:glyoxylase-like metal-dependent hydrolase (beta-lactamase superfamily II)